jgi:hypothetical protein
MSLCQCVNRSTFVTNWLRKYNDCIWNNPSIYLNGLKVLSPVNHETRDTVAVETSCYLLYLHAQNVPEVTDSVAEHCNDNEMKLVCSCTNLYSI